MHGKFLVLCAAAALALAAAVFSACSSENATGEEYERMGTVASVEMTSRSVGGGDTQWIYDTRFDFPDELPSGQRSASSRDVYIHDLCEGHEGEAALVTFDEHGDIAHVTFQP